MVGGVFDIHNICQTAHLEYSNAMATELNEFLWEAFRVTHDC